MAKEFVVAIELGSSKITGIAGQKNIDGSVSVLSVVKEDATQCIRKGVVYNIDKTVQVLTNIINKLEKQLKTKIIHVFVGVGGQSIHSMKNVVPKDLPIETIVTQEMVNELMDSNRSMVYPEQEILDAVVQEFKVDLQYQLDPVGILCKHLEGNFLNILWRKSFYRKLTKCFENAGIDIADMFISPLVLADSILTEADKRAGCVLVDLGAETTTVSVYHKNILRHLSVVPLGSNNITKDIASLQVEDSYAEKIKIRYGEAYKEDNLNSETKIPLEDDRTLDATIFDEIVEARTEEIIRNAWEQVPAEYSDKILNGIILTGGGSNMSKIERAFMEYTNVDKIRIAKFVTLTVKSSDLEALPHDGTINTCLGILDKGNINCAGEEITDDLFGPGIGSHKPKKLGGEVGQGIIHTEVEKQKAEEEARKKKEAEEEAARIAEEARLREDEERRKNSTLNKGIGKLKNFFQKIVQEDDE